MLHFALCKHSHLLFFPSLPYPQQRDLVGGNYDCDSCDTGVCDCCAVVFSRQLLPGLLGLLVLLCGGYRPLLPREGNTYTSTLSSIIFSLKDLTSVTIVWSYQYILSVCQSVSQILI